MSENRPVSAHCLNCVLGLFVQYTPPFWTLDLETWREKSSGPSAPQQSTSAELRKSIPYFVLKANECLGFVFVENRNQRECGKPQLCEDLVLDRSWVWYRVDVPLGAQSSEEVGISGAQGSSHSCLSVSSRQ